MVTTVPEEGLVWQGPVVWWNPVDGWRHAFRPDKRPRPGQQRDTLCELTVTLIEPSDVDWLMPTCDTCMAHARVRMHKRETNLTPDIEEERERRRKGWTR